MHFVYDGKVCRLQACIPSSAQVVSGGRFENKSLGGQVGRRRGWLQKNWFIGKGGWKRMLLGNPCLSSKRSF